MNKEKSELPQGTLDTLIPEALQPGAVHGLHRAEHRD